MPTTRVDLHVKVLDDAVVDRAKARGLDALVYAPHFQRVPEIRETAAAYSSEDLLVVPGREIFAGPWNDRRHLLGVGVTDPVPDFIDLPTAFEALTGQDAAVLVPHPTFLTVSLDADEVAANVARIDAVETYNPKHLAHHNDRAVELVADLEVPAFGSSYAHLPGTVGEVWTTFDRDITSEAALVEALQTGVQRTVAHRPGAGHRLRCLAEFGHLAWENSWQKIDRVLLSGMEPTHPRHVAYDGEFEDAAVY